MDTCRKYIGAKHHRYCLKAIGCTHSSYSLMQNQILLKGELVHHHIRNPMKQIQSITPKKPVSNCLLLLGWTEGKAEVPRFALSTTHMHFLVTLRASFLTTDIVALPPLEKCLLNIVHNREVHSALKSPS